MTVHSKFWLALWSGLAFWLLGGTPSVSAQDAPPIVLVIDSSEDVNSQARHADLYEAVEKVVFFIAAYNPVSLVTTCSPITGTQSPTQDIAILRTALDQLKPDLCSPLDQAQALHTAVSQLGDQTGDIIYLLNGHFLTGGMDDLQQASAAALTPLQETRSCLYVIPIGNTPAISIDRDVVQDLVNAAGCGQRYEGQKTPTIASTLLEAALLSQGRTLMTRYGEQLPLFSRATAKLNQSIPIKDDMQAVRIDVIWGTGALDVALQAPTESTEPIIVSGEGYQSLVVPDPAAGPWNIKLSVTQVPENQVAIVLFSQANPRNAPIQSNGQPTMSAAATPLTSAAVSTPPPETTSSDVPTVVMVRPISDTMAAPATSVPMTPVPVTPLPDAIPAASELADNPLPIIATVAIMGLVGMFLVLWSRRGPAQNKPAASAGSTLHSRPTSELPPMPLNVTAGTPVSDKRRSVQTHAPIAPDAGFGEAQFRQFPALVMFKNGPQSGQIFDVNSGYFMIGRRSTSDLRVQDGTVSREHARIIFDNAQNLYLIENVSQAGTQVNGQYITQRRPLYSGDLIQVGNIQIHFQLRVHPQI